MKNKTSDAPLPDKEQIWRFLNSEGKPIKIESILNSLGYVKSEKKEIKKALDELARDNRAIRLPGGKWSAPGAIPNIAGNIQFTRSGVKFIPENGQPEISLSQSQAGGAWDQDYVSVALVPDTAPTEARVIEIIRREQPEVAARFLRRDGKTLVFRTIGKKAPVFFKIFSPKNQPLHLHPGQLAAIRPVKPLPDGDWHGELIRKYDEENTLAIQEELVKLNHNVPGTFPDLALSQAASLPETPQKADLDGREDMRNVNFITIDGADARDFDDAINVERTGNGWLLRVAIADVSHYVPPDADPDSLDQEALRRGNSWYFPKSVEPMLPKSLSNGLCSLNPGADRLAMLAEIPFDKHGNPGKPRFAPIVMRSKARLTYDQAADFFDGKKGEAPAEIAPMLAEAHSLYRALAQKRRDRGSLDFDLPEATYSFNQDGSLAEIKHASRNDAHMLIEEFMIAANEAVASWLEDRKFIFPYRAHPCPEAMKLAALLETLQKISPHILPHDVKADTLADPRALREILLKAKGTPSEYVVNRLILRAMSQARYQTENVGHFALASPSYCHFTSPIRRYADLLVHRTLKASLDPAKKADLPDEESLAKINAHLNTQERKAIDCEREMAKRLACLLLGQKVGETLTGSISGVAEFGLFVEFNELPAEGIIKIRELGGDWFELDQRRQMLIGQNSGQTFQLGQPVKVRIEGIDEDRMEVRLSLAEGAKSAGSKRRGSKSFETEKRREAPLKAATRSGKRKSQFTPSQKRHKHGH